MLSFQILDGGEVLTFSLESRPVLIGTAADCDIRLRSPGVAEHHARVEPVPRDGALLYKLVDLGSTNGTRVNGESVAQVALAVGDRIEIAGARLVFGKRVVRRATAEDVLADSVRTRLPRRREGAAKHPWLPYAIVAGVALLIGVVWFLGSDRPPASLMSVPELLAKGDHEEAERLVQHARVTWAGNSAVRLAALDGYASEVTRFRRQVEALEKEVVTTADSRSVGDQISELRRRESAAGDAIERAAVRRVMGRVQELRQGAARAPVADAGRGAEASAAVPAPTLPAPNRRADSSLASGDKPTSHAANATKTTAGPPSMPAGEDLVARAEQALLRNDLRVAGQLIEQMSADQALAAKAAPLRAQWVASVEALRLGARTQADELVALGRGADASAFLRDLAVRLPDAQRDELERHAKACAEAQPAVAPPAKAKSFTDPLGDLLRLVEASESAFGVGDFARAKQQFTVAAERVGSRDAGFAAELRARGEDCDLLVGLHGAVARALRAAPKPEIRLADEQKARLVDCDATRLRFTADAGELSLSWTELPAAAVDAILKAVDASAEAFLGAAVLALGQGDEALAEHRLLSAVRKDAGVKSVVDRLLARSRAERVPDSGYKIDGGRFVAAALSPLVKELDGKLGAALRSDAKAREVALSEVLARGPDQLEAVIQVLRRQQRTLADRLQNHPFKKSWERLAAERQKLDAARAHALELIFDEERYFYPYSPPAVSSEKATQYHRVQREVNERVEAVRAIWEGSSLQFNVPEGIAIDLERFRWVTGVLEGFGERSSGVTARMRWLLAIPEARVLDIKRFCRDTDEVERDRLAERIARLNTKRAASLTSAERDELKLTNDYRVMMGRSPLVVDLRVLAAARKHCEEMERMGYFGHISPVAENRTPYDRMRVAGYAHGGSENIASNDSAVGAHTAWLNSSGHHRNILGVAHTEFACGQRGRLWTQNFGAGRDFESELPP